MQEASDPVKSGAIFRVKNASTLRSPMPKIPSIKMPSNDALVAGANAMMASTKKRKKRIRTQQKTKEAKTEGTQTQNQSTTAPNQSNGRPVGLLDVLTNFNHLVQRSPMPKCLLPTTEERPTTTKKKKKKKKKPKALEALEASEPEREQEPEKVLEVEPERREERVTTVTKKRRRRPRSECIKERLRSQQQLQPEAEKNETKHEENIQKRLFVGAEDDEDDEDHQTDQKPAAKPAKARDAAVGTKRKATKSLEDVIHRPAVKRKETTELQRVSKPVASGKQEAKQKRKSLDELTDAPVRTRAQQQQAQREENKKKTEKVEEEEEEEEPKPRRRSARLSSESSGLEALSLAPPKKPSKKKSADKREADRDKRQSPDQLKSSVLITKSDGIKETSKPKEKVARRSSRLPRDNESTSVEKTAVISTQSSSKEDDDDDEEKQEEAQVEEKSNALKPKPKPKPKADEKPKVSKRKNKATAEKLSKPTPKARTTKQQQTSAADGETKDESESEEKPQVKTRSVTTAEETKRPPKQKPPAPITPVKPTKRSYKTKSSILVMSEWYLAWPPTFEDDEVKGPQLQLVLLGNVLGQSVRFQMAKRTSMLQFVTTDGSAVALDGCLDIERAYRAGVPPQVMELMVEGIPPNWRRRLEACKGVLKFKPNANQPPKKKPAKDQVDDDHQPKRSRSGRQLTPVMDWWRNERLRTDLSGKTVIEHGSPAFIPSARHNVATEKSVRSVNPAASKALEAIERIKAEERRRAAEAQWTPAQLAALEDAKVSIPTTVSNFWVEVAKIVPGKSADDCRSKSFEELASPVERKSGKRAAPDGESLPPTKLFRAGSNLFKKQVRQFVNEYEKKHVDDVFGAHTPSKSMLKSVDGLDDLKSPAAASVTPGKSPQAEELTSGRELLEKITDAKRDEVDSYVLNLKRSHHPGTTDRRTEFMTPPVRKKPSVRDEMMIKERV